MFFQTTTTGFFNKRFFAVLRKEIGSKEPVASGSCDGAKKVAESVAGFG